MASWNGSIQGGQPFSSIPRGVHDGEKQIKRLDMAIRIVAIAAIACFVLTIALIGLAQAGYIHPLAGLISFGAIFPALFIIKVIDCCRKPVARKHGIDLESYDKVHLQKNKESKRRPRSESGSGSESESD